jgi:hypothetical protein
MLQNLAMNEKQSEIMKEWYAEKRLKTFIKIDNSFNACDKINSELSNR